jgi:hypothetical protein
VHESWRKQLGAADNAARAVFLGSPLDADFSISFELRPHVSGNTAAVAEIVQAEPIERLSQSELIKMAVP